MQEGYGHTAAAMHMVAVAGMGVVAHMAALAAGLHMAAVGRCMAAPHMAVVAEGCTAGQVSLWVEQLVWLWASLRARTMVLVCSGTLLSAALLESMTVLQYSAGLWEPMTVLLLDALSVLALVFWTEPPSVCCSGLVMATLLLALR